MTDTPTPTAASAPTPSKTAAPAQATAKAAPRPTAKPAGKPSARPAARKTPAKQAKPRRALMRPGLLPATIFVAMLVLGFKVGDIWLTVTTGKGLSLVPASVAEESVPQGLPDAGGKGGVPALSVPAPTRSSAPASTTPATTQVAEAPASEQQSAASPPAPTNQAGAEHGQAAPVDHGAPAAAGAAGPAPSGAPGQGFTPTEVELLQRLQERREQLDTRARELDQREAMLAAAETRFDRKIAELQNLKKEIQGLLTQANAEQQAQLDSLVKIYETMKPVDAAKIFNNLENNVLLNVISRMKEAKVAPVFAAMDEKRAQEVTILLAARKRLPTELE